MVRTVVYTYDDLSRLTREQITHRDSSKNRTTTYTYDSVGNRLTKVVGSTTTSYAYDDNDRLLTETTGTTVIGYSYDASGNTTRKESKTGGVTTAIVTYAYDDENHLLEARQGTSDSTLMLAARYVYDADGNRVKTTASGTSTTHLVDTNRPYAEVLEEVATSMTSTSRTSYVHGDDLISQVRSTGTPSSITTSYFHQDGLGSTRVLTSDTGVVTDTYSYEAFGTLTESTGSTPNTYLFTGEPRDPATGFYYLRARWMDPAVGRFVNKDAFQGIATDPSSLHKYLYVKSDPINYVDPSGHLFAGGFGLAPPLTIATPAITRIALTRVATALILSVGALAVATAPTVALQRLIRECIQDGGRTAGCRPQIPILVYGADVLEHTKHVADAISSTSPRVLTRIEPKHRPQWYRYKRECKERGAEQDCDEYPYRSTAEGGPDNYEIGTVSLRPIGLSANRAAGGLLESFYNTCGVTANSPRSRFVVVPAETIPETRFVCSQR